MLTNHPFVSGRASRAAALEGLIARASAIDGLWIATCAEIAAHVETLDLRAGRPPAARSLPEALRRDASPDEPGSVGAIGRQPEGTELGEAFSRTQ